MSVNKVILVGNVGKDPETRYLDEGTAMTKFSMATSETYKNRAGERVTTTEWHNIILWRGLAKVAEQYVRKGSQIYIEGRIRTRSYDDQDGNRKYITEIVGDEMKLLGKRPDEPTAQNGQYQGSYQNSQAAPQQNIPQHNTSQGAAPQESSPQGSSPQGSSPQGSSPQDNTPPNGTYSTGNEEGDPFGNDDNGPDDLPF